MLAMKAQSPLSPALNGWLRLLVAALIGLCLLIGLAGCTKVEPDPSQPAIQSAQPDLPPLPEVALYDPIDHILVDKSDRTLSVFRQGQLIKVYRGIGLGDAPYGHKQFQGDERTPEGLYTIDTRNPQSAYHLSLRISYPNRDDRRFAQSYGRDPGGDIFIHGQPNAMPFGRIPGDWTDGCIAVSNEEIEELWRIVADGTSIEIRP